MLREKRLQLLPVLAIFLFAVTYFVLELRTSLPRPKIGRPPPLQQVHIICIYYDYVEVMSQACDESRS